MEKIILLAILWIVIVIAAIDTTIHTKWVKRKMGLCWEFHCFRKVTDCRASAKHNGPMCLKHCREASYHAFFCGCGTLDGIPIMDRDRASINLLKYSDLGRHQASRFNGRQ
jgi:hypothetical protein